MPSLPGRLGSKVKGVGSVFRALGFRAQGFMQGFGAARVWEV